MSGDPDAAARLAAVQAKFAGKLRDRIDELARTVAAAQTDAQRLAEAITPAHRLAGTAGSFGYADAGAEALQLEVKLLELRDGSADADPPLWPEIDAQLQRVVATKPAG